VTGLNEASSTLIDRLDRQAVPGEA
jgi:hypothetical protein